MEHVPTPSDQEAKNLAGEVKSLKKLVDSLEVRFEALASTVVAQMVNASEAQATIEAKLTELIKNGS